MKKNGIYVIYNWRRANGAEIGIFPPIKKWLAAGNIKLVQHYVEWKWTKIFLQPLSSFHS